MPCESGRAPDACPQSSHSGWTPICSPKLECGAISISGRIVEADRRAPPPRLGGVASRLPPICASLSMSTLIFHRRGAARVVIVEPGVERDGVSTVSPASAIRLPRSFSVPPFVT